MTVGDCYAVVYERSVSGENSNSYLGDYTSLQKAEKEFVEATKAMENPGSTLRSVSLVKIMQQEHSQWPVPLK